MNNNINNDKYDVLIKDKIRTAINTKDYQTEYKAPFNNELCGIPYFVKCGNIEYVAMQYKKKYIILNDKGELAFKRPLDERSFVSGYKVITEDELVNKELVKVMLDAPKKVFPGMSLSNNTSYSIDLLSNCIRYDEYRDMYAFVTNDNDKPENKGYVETHRQDSVTNYLIAEQKKVNKDLYGDIWSYEIKPNITEEQHKEWCKALLRDIFKKGVFHINNGKIMVDKNGKELVYKELSSSPSQVRKGDASLCLASEYDIIRKNCMELGITDFIQEDVSIAKTEARFTSGGSNGVLVALFDCNGNVAYFPEYRTTNLKDGVTTFTGDVVITKYEDSEQMQGSEIIKDHSMEVEYTDGNSPCTNLVSADMSYYIGRITKEERDYYFEVTTINSIIKYKGELKEHFGETYVENSIKKIAEENNLEYNGESIKEIKENNKILYDAIVNDCYYFSHIDVNLLKKSKKYNKIHKRISHMNIVRQLNEYVKGTLITEDNEYKKIGAEIGLRKSMRKLHDILDPLLEEGKMQKKRLPWVVCKTADKKEKVTIFKQAIMQMAFKHKKSLENRALEEILQMQIAFTNAEVAKEMLKIKRTSENGDVENTPDDLKAVKLLQINEALLSSTMIQKKMCDLFKYRLYNIAQGRLSVDGTVCFIVSDPFFGTDKELKKGEYYYNGMDNVDCIIHRAPANGPLEAFKINLTNKEHLNYLHNVLVMNCYDCIWQGLGGADFDGDTVFLIWDKWWVDQYLQTNHIIVIKTKGKMKAKFSRDNRREALIASVGGGEVGKLTNANMNFFDYVYSTYSPKAFALPGMIELMGESASNVGIDIDKAKTGQKSIPRDSWLNTVKGTKDNPIRKSHHAYYDGKMKRGQYAKGQDKDSFWKAYSITGKEYDVRWKVIRKSNHPMEHLFLMMEELFQVTLNPMNNTVWQDYTDDNHTINDTPIINKLIEVFNKDEIAKAMPIIAELENSYRTALSELIVNKRNMNKETFSKMREILIEEHSMYFELECEKNNINKIVGAIVGFMVPVLINSKSREGKKVSTNYSLDCCYKFLYEGLNYAYNSIVKIDLPIKTKDDTITVTNGKVRINGFNFKMQVEDGEYEVINNSFIEYRIKLENVSNSLANTEDTIKFVTRDLKQGLNIPSILEKAPTTGMSPLEAFLVIKNNGFKFRIQKDAHDNYVMYVGNKIVGVVYSSYGMFNTNIIGKELVLTNKELVTEDKNTLIEGIKKVFGAKKNNSAKARSYNLSFLKDFSVREVVTFNVKVVGETTEKATESTLNGRIKSPTELLEEAKKIEKDLNNPDGIDYNATDTNDKCFEDQEDCVFSNDDDEYYDVILPDDEM